MPGSSSSSSSSSSRGGSSSSGRANGTPRHASAAVRSATASITISQPSLNGRLVTIVTLRSPSPAIVAKRRRPGAKTAPGSLTVGWTISSPFTPKARRTTAT